MAVSNTNQPQQPAQAPAQNNQQPQQGQPAVSGFGFPWTFHGGMTAAPMARDSSEKIGKAKEALAEAFSVPFADWEITLLELPNGSETGLAFGCILIAVRWKKRPELGVAFHTLILEETGDKPQPFIENINGQQVEIKTYASTAYDAKLSSLAVQKVAVHFSTQQVMDVDATVVPERFNWTDKTMVKDLAYRSGLAATSELEQSQPGWTDVNLATAKKDSTLAIELSFQRRTVLDVVGLPVRRDIGVVFKSVQQAIKNGERSINTAARDTLISEVSAYVDLLYDPAAPVNDPYATYGQQAQRPAQKYIANVVLTKLDSQFSYTPAAILLAAMTALTLSENNCYIQSFRPGLTSSKEIDITDIGAMNIEANLQNEPTPYGTRIDVKAADFTLESLGRLVQMLVQPGMAVSIDCPECGADSWYLALLSAAASGRNPNAVNRFMDAANQLTNGYFRANFPANENLFINHDNWVHMGYWIDNNGNMRDIREIDNTIAVANLVGDTNPNFIRDYADTYWGPEAFEIRFAKRAKMLQALTKDTLVLTGRAHRVTFAGRALQVLSDGVKATGITIRSTSPMSGFDLTAQRAVANMGDGRVLPNQGFTTSGSTYGGNGNFQRQWNGGRW